MRHNIIRAVSFLHEQYVADDARGHEPALAVVELGVHLYAAFVLGQHVIAYKPVDQ